MSLTRELTRRTMEAPEPAEAPPAAGGPRHDPAESFARLSRAVRLTLALEAKIEAEMTSPRPAAKPRRSWDRFAAANDIDPGGDDDAGDVQILDRDYPYAHRNLIRDNVWEAINREITEMIPAQQLLDDVQEALTEGDRYDAFIHRPLRETVAAICEDLGLAPDWSGWTEDGWPEPGMSTRIRWQQLWGPFVPRITAPRGSPERMPNHPAPPTPVPRE